MASDQQKIIEKVANVARQVSRQQNPIVSGTVISKNQDGSLNVNDGQGGCVRVARKMAAHIGDRVTLGTEPALGTITNLPEIDIVIPPSTLECPSDPRDPDPPPIDAPPLTALTIRYTGHNESFPTWADRGTDYGTHGSGPSTSVDSGMRAYSEYRSDGILICRRGFCEFPTAGILPANAILSAATLKFSVSAGSIWTSGPGTVSQTYSFGDFNVIVVPSIAGHFTLSTPGTALIADAVMNAGPMGRFRIRDIVAGGVLYEIPLDLEVLNPYFNVGGATKLAIVTQPDFDEVRPDQDPGATFHGENISMGDIIFPYPKLALTYIPQRPPI